jgi:zinc transport system ATP-binding protein
MIYINNLHFSYNPASPFLIKNINLHIGVGDYISIVGENGSAKSTLLKLILGLLKPNSGEIILNTKTLGYVPQRMDSYNSEFPITVQEILQCHLKALKLNNKKLISESLDKVNMLSYKNTLIGNLSGGQQQKIFIARAIMTSPKLIILDEPSTGIDIKSQKEIYKILRDLNQISNITIISVEHNLKAALENSTHIYRMEKGAGTLFNVKDYVNKFVL